MDTKWRAGLIVCALAFLTFSTPSFAADKVFNAESFSLENGMEVVVIPNHRAPVVTHMVWYNVGAADEPQGLSGIAHFLEHLMFKGSPVIGKDEVLKPGEFSEIVRRLGGRDNAFTGQDFTAYFQSIASQHLETLMRMEAGRVRGMNPPPEHVLSERQVIREERRQRTDNNPHALFNEELAVSLYPDHPYGIPIIGWADEVEALSWEDTKKFYDIWYSPNNATLIVTGDVTGKQVYDLAREIYGSVPAHDLPERERAARPPMRDLISPIKYEHKSIRQPIVQKAYKVPSYRESKQDALALQILESIVGSGPTSRLYRSLVVKHKLASSAALSYSAESWDSTSLWVYASPLPGIELKAIEKALDASLRKVIADGVTDEELRDAKSRMQNEAIYARDSLSGPAMVIGRALASGLSLDDVEYWPADIEKVTAAQIQDVARRYLDPDKNSPLTGYLLPKAMDETEEKVTTTPGDSQ